MQEEVYDSYLKKKKKEFIYTFNSSLLIVFSNQAMVPSPPATSMVDGVFPNKRHHSRAATGSRSAKSMICAGFNNLLNKDKIWPPSLFPDFVFPAQKKEF